MTRDIRRSLTADSRCWAEVDAEDIDACLEMAQGTSIYLQGSYTVLKRKYRHTLARKTNSSGTDMEKVYREYVTLYQRSVPTHTTPLQTDGGFLTEAEVEA